MLAAVACLSGALIARGLELSTVPLVTSLEALLFYAWLLLVVFLVLVRRDAHRTLGALLVPLAALPAAVSAAFMAPAWPARHRRPGPIPIRSPRVAKSES